MGGIGFNVECDHQRRRSARAHDVHPVRRQDGNPAEFNKQNVGTVLRQLSRNLERRSGSRNVEGNRCSGFVQDGTQIGRQLRRVRHQSVPARRQNGHGGAAVDRGCQVFEGGRHSFSTSVIRSNIEWRSPASLT